MSDHEPITEAQDTTPVEVARPRRPYEAPRCDSGAAFERVQLQSGCAFFDPLDCDPLC